jgi:hypothetical protein
VSFRAYLKVCGPTFDWLGVRDWLGVFTLPVGFKNCSIYPLEGGQAKVLLGRVLGICVLVINGCCIISSSVGLFDGSRIRILVIRFLAFSEIVT